MKVAALFSNNGVLDFEELRTSVIRIPQVLQYLKNGQRILDRLIPEAPDLIQFMTSSDEKFWQHPNLRKLVIGLCQIGLYERYVKYHGKADCLLSVENVSGPIRVISGDLLLSEYIMDTYFAEEKQEDINLGEMPVLSKGISMPEFHAFSINDDGNLEKLVEEKKRLDEILMELRDEHGVKQFINIGPGQSMSGNSLATLISKELNILESIDIDPMLSWFWQSVDRQVYQIAN